MTRAASGRATPPAGWTPAPRRTATEADARALAPDTTTVLPITRPARRAAGAAPSEIDTTPAAPAAATAAPAAASPATTAAPADPPAVTGAAATLVGGPPRPRRPGWLRWLGRAVAGAVLLAFVVVGWSLGHALAGPSSDRLAAKAAEWGRDHHLGPVINYLEQKQYDLNKPKVGGLPAGGVRIGSGPVDPGLSAPAPRSSHAPRPRTRLPAPLTPFTPGDPAEGQWKPLVAVGGQPALLGTALAPDPVHTSYLAHVAWMDPKLLRFQLRPGDREPRGTWPLPPRLPPSDRAGLVAAFNSGFRLNGESRGGWCLGGTCSAPLRAGAASFVVRTDGTAAIGAWGRDLGPGPGVYAVRQNLDLLVDHGQIPASVDAGSGSVWGNTLHSYTYAWRSGVGTTRDGAVVYAMGINMTTRTLGEVLRRAGAVQAMELDINPDWTHLDYFTRAADGSTIAHALDPAQQQGPRYYLGDDGPSFRDFFAVYARGNPR